MAGFEANGEKATETEMGYKKPNAQGKLGDTEIQTVMGAVMKETKGGGSKADSFPKPY